MDVSISHDPFQPDVGDFTKPRKAKAPAKPRKAKAPAKDAAPVSEPAPRAESS